jgi:hypothetical protein
MDEGYERGRAQLARTVDEHPLVTSVAFLALGVLTSFLVPETDRENQWLGETAEKVRRRAKEKGEDLLDRGKHVVEATVEAAKREAAEQGLTPQGLKESAKEVAKEAKEAARRTAQEEGLDPQKLKEQGGAGKASGTPQSAPLQSGVNNPHQG